MVDKIQDAAKIDIDIRLDEQLLLANSTIVCGGVSAVVSEEGGVSGVVKSG